MTWPKRVLLVLLAVTAGVVFQPQTPRPAALPAHGLACPPGIAILSAGVGHLDGTVTCRGWSRPEFVAGAGPADVLLRPRTPHINAPCADVHYYRVTLVVGANRTSALFAFAGGAATGILPLTADQAHRAAGADAYVTDVQLGSVEAAGSGGEPVCVIDPTYHFLCPATHAVDRFCLSWVRRSRIGVPG